MRRKTGCRGRESVFAAEREAYCERERERRVRERCVKEANHERERERCYWEIDHERKREVNCYNDKKNYNDV